MAGITHRGPPSEIDKGPLRVKSRHRKVIGACPLHPLKADIRRANRNVSFGPTAEVGLSLDRFIGGGDERRREFEAKRRGSFQVDGQFKFRRLIEGNF